MAVGGFEYHVFLRHILTRNLPSQKMFEWWLSVVMLWTEIHRGVELCRFTSSVAFSVGEECIIPECLKNKVFRFKVSDAFQFFQLLSWIRAISLKWRVKVLKIRLSRYETGKYSDTIKFFKILDENCKWTFYVIFLRVEFIICQCSYLISQLIL